MELKLGICPNVIKKAQDIPHEMPLGHSQCHLVGQNSKQYHPEDDWRAINGGPVATEKTAVVWTCLEDASPLPPGTTCTKQTKWKEMTSRWSTPALV